MTKVQIKDSTLYHVDCQECLSRFDDNSIDLVFTSPPYNMRLRVRNGKYTTRENAEHFSKKYEFFDDALPIEEYYKTHKDILTELLRISKTILWNISIVTGSKEAIFKLIGDFNKSIKDIIVWDKGYGQPAMHEKCINRTTELIIIFENDALAGRTLNRAYFKRGEMQDILRIKRPLSKLKEHKAVFPMELTYKIIENFSKEGDLILDPFMGSGSTGIACAIGGRKFIGIEKEKQYFDIACKRIRWANKQQALF